MEAAESAACPSVLDMPGDGGFAERDHDHHGHAAASGAMAAATTDKEAVSEASCVSNTGSSDGDAVLSDAVTVILDCSNSGAVAGDDIAAAAVLEDVPVPRQWRDAVADAVADAGEDVDGCVPTSGLDVTWSWLMEE
jgi:hypothetical protein